MLHPPVQGRSSRGRTCSGDGVRNFHFHCLGRSYDSPLLCFCALRARGYHTYVISRTARTRMFAWKPGILTEGFHHFPFSLKAVAVIVTD
jgi:hypothetical protein